MDKEEQPNSDKRILASLEAEYKRAQRVINSIRALITDLNFEELIPDSQERCLMEDELQAYDYIRAKLMNRIRFYRNRVKRDENIKDWSQYKKTDSVYIGVDVSDEGDHSACSQVCGDGIATHHCGQDECNRSGLITLEEAVKDYVENCDENGRLKINLHHCGQDCDCDDACCQAGSPCGRSTATYDPNESQPVDVSPAITGESLRNILGMQVCRCNVPCDVCSIDKRVGACVKLELVGGDYICLAPLPNSVVTE